MTFTRIFSAPQRKNTIFLFSFLTFWLNATVAMVAPPPLTVCYITQSTENPYTPTDILTTRHIIPNIRSSLSLKLYSAGLTLTSQIKRRSTVNYRTYAVQSRSTVVHNGFPTRTTFLTSSRQQPQNTQYNNFTSISYIQDTSEKVKEF